MTIRPPGRRVVIRPVSAQEAALARLREYLLTGQLPPGARVSQRAVADELRCSIVPIREALKTLEAEGQVTHIPQRGYFVAVVDLNELVEAYRIRELLETEAVRNAVPRLTDGDLTRLAALNDQVRTAAESEDIRDMVDANRLLHFTLYERSGMQRLVRVIRMMWEMTDRYRSFYYLASAHRDRVNAEHDALLRALADRDAEAAVRVLDEHRQNTVQSLRSAFGPDGQPLSRASGTSRPRPGRGRWRGLPS